MNRVQKQVQLKLNQRTSLEYSSESALMDKMKAKPPDNEKNTPNLKDSPLRPTINDQILLSAKRMAENVNKIDIPRKPMKNIEDVLSLKDLELDLPLIQTTRQNADDKHSQNKQTKENVLTKLTSSQRALCAAIDHIM